ncbi:3-hydroxyacyl-CoA dehydrogenase NAD-binding domain-containing protein [Piscinibacter gummiphilus]|uniref:3-hydroxyacyl-CoA dehydrogenase NAD-binding domain-containing protein n=1 Tax=Piscinibacter gummiphilus TaxID=946333 RepID=A0ABZ0CSS4_9BURK|nr:3-hydroxyacyl-CoA dehydrogenase NAD-binding domain-containing protein [Piscinibacter gummiphilus]WOB07566.1 3-hydroxyacyl-CoA dehydrogenase NAD-binding domain-containing protein [Piscinibacter gummiphilus]
MTITNNGAVSETSGAGTFTVEGDIGILTIDYPPVNALSQATRQGIVSGMQAAAANPDVKAVVLICAGRTFLAGADITEFGKPPKAPSLREAQDLIENSSKPVIAAIHGTALGGGLEVAMCCHYRVGVESAKCGLPEVLIGVLPGAGGTQRLPRLVGVEKGLDMIVNGTHVPAKECLAMGLLDALVPEGELRSSAIAFAKKVLAENRPLRKVRDLDDKIAAVRGKPEIFAAVRKANAKKFRGLPAPEACIQCVEAAVNGSFEDGLATERRLFQQLVTGTESIAQRYAFFAQREAAKIPGIPADTPLVDVKKVGIIGAGTMGGGIAMNFANVGIPVILVETAQAALDRGLGVIRKNYENSAKKGRFTQEEVEKRMALLTGTLEMEQLADCDLVIEAVFENMAVKKEIFGKLDRIVKPGAVLATNTSALDVNEIASAATSRPEAVVGMHFFSPANVMKLLEVVRGAKTSDTALATAMHIGKKIGKVAAISGVCPGFIGNRILSARGAQAHAMLMEGAMPWDIDQVLYDFGMPMGPYAMSDLAGLDLGWSKDKSKSSTIREVLCEMDRRGQKTGAGYYDYDENRNARPSEVTKKVILDFMAKEGRTPREIGKDEILERCIYAMVNEGAKILEEGIALRASDIDVVWLNGYGWPVYRGGPMFYADTVGLDNVVAKLKEYGPRMGANFKISPLLEKMAADGKKFVRT